MMMRPSYIGSISSLATRLTAGPSLRVNRNDLDITPGVI